EVLGLCMLVATAVGTVDMVLLMGGKSSWNMINTVVGLSSNIALNFLLIPRYGGTGAAIAWSSSILFTNLAPLAQVWKFLGMPPQVPGVRGCPPTGTAPRSPPLTALRRSWPAQVAAKPRRIWHSVPTPQVHVGDEVPYKPDIWD